MPYWEGKRVSNAEWRRLRGDKPLTWKEAVGYGSAEEAPAVEPEAEPEKPRRQRRQGTKKADAEAAVAAITGLDINLGDEEENE
jgi:hypothetical protein